MWSMEVESNGPEGGPLLSRHMKDADDGSLSPERGDRRKRKGKRSRNFVHKHHMLLRRILKV